MADKSKQGLSLPSYRLRIERVKIKEFVEAIGDPNPIYVDPEAAISQGYRDTPCPPTFATMAFQEFTGAYFKAFEELGIPLEKVLHGEEEYEYLAEIYPGDTLNCTMTFESIVEKTTKSGKMDLITLHTTFNNQNGQEVIRARSLIIERK
ncbi:MAG: MaoC family dehydratase N-terminal domain-containing protein [Deltaproteobacteria bacterium]|nr:MaoC family dehydratase N-terminal domain-containing protein [Deltaproteobacteria bacterium]